MKDWLVNILVFVGGALIAWGMYLIYAPLLPIAVGVLFIGLAIAMTRADEYRKRTPR